MLQRFLVCKTEEFDFDMDGEKAPICYKEITTALRQWILPTFVSPLNISLQMILHSYCSVTTKYYKPQIDLYILAVKYIKRRIPKVCLNSETIDLSRSFYKQPRL